jgi:5-methylcytosine-specific restriction endonuclease McrA
VNVGDRASAEGDDGRASVLRGEPEVESELDRLTAGWNAVQVAREYPTSLEGLRAELSEDALFRAHGYVASVGSTRPPYTSRDVEYRRRTPADVAFLRIGLGSTLPAERAETESFECASCGRWGSTVQAAGALESALVRLLGLTWDEWAQLRAAANDAPLRPAYLQRELGRTYEQAVETLENGRLVGLLRPHGNGFVLAEAICGTCVAGAMHSLVAPAVAPKSAARDAIPPRMRFRVLQRDAFRCTYCGRTARDGAVLHLDHLVPVAAGGQTTEDNLVTACDTCNVGKSDLGVLADSEPAG